MTDLIERVLTMSAQAGVLILCLLLVRLFARGHISPRLSYGLWLLPALRLLLPFRIQSGLSLGNLVPAAVEAAAPPAADVILTATDIRNAPALPPAPIPAPAAGAVYSEAALPPAPSLMTVLFWIWLIGATLMLLYMLAVNARFSLRVTRLRTRLEAAATLPVYLVPELNSPCLFGFFRPAVLVNKAAMQSEESFSLVLKHELCHHRAGDLWWALLRNLLCALHWFNPLVWLAAVYSRSDCELACDARVIKGFSQEERERYGMALLSTLRKSGAKTSFVSATTSMTGSKRELQKRILRVQTAIDVKELMTAEYIDIAFNDKAWDTLSIAIGKAYGDELFPDTPIVPETDAIHRAGYREAQLTFTGSNTIDPKRPDIRYYDWHLGRFAPTAYETAQLALRTLYDMTGVQVEHCYVSGTWSGVNFSTSKRSRDSFFSFGYGFISGGDGKLLYIMTLNYKGKDFPNSPIDPATMAKPARYEALTPAELALWYYENSSYGDRRPIVKAVDGIAGLNLTLDTGEFYEVDFDYETELPSRFCGPYPEGFTH